jgi:DNA polymerase III sliding clamp (beta) subunit (PCNA family)
MVTVTHGFLGAGSSSTFQTLDGEFPKFRKLIPDASDVPGTEMISFNPAYLASVDKIPHERNTPVTWKFYGSGRPAVGTYDTCNGIDWLFLLMPVRITK